MRRAKMRCETRSSLCPGVSSSVSCRRRRSRSRYSALIKTSSTTGKNSDGPNLDPISPSRMLRGAPNAICVASGIECRIACVAGKVDDRSHGVGQPRQDKHAEANDERSRPIVERGKPLDVDSLDQYGDRARGCAGQDLWASQWNRKPSDERGTLYRERGLRRRRTSERNCPGWR